MLTNQETISYNITGSSNLNMRRDATLNIINSDMNKVNVSGLSNCYDKTNITTSYYAKTYFSTYYYDKTTIDRSLSTPAKPHHGGFISSAGAINISTGTFTYKIKKTGTGVYHIFYDYSSAIANYTVLCNPRIGTAAFLTYSIQTATSVNIYMVNGRNGY